MTDLENNFEELNLEEIGQVSGGHPVSALIFVPAAFIKYMRQGQDQAAREGKSEEQQRKEMETYAWGTFGMG